MTDHPITPPPELVKQWWKEAQAADYMDLPCWVTYVATRAAQWGADQELEACCAFAENKTWGLVNGLYVADAIHTARRPKPMSLKVEALRGLEGLAARLEEAGLTADLAVLYRALEQLDD